MRYVGWLIQRRWQVLLILVAAAALGTLMLYKLGSLTPGLSAGEVQSANAAVGWHGLYYEPLFLPLKLIRSVVFFLFPVHGQWLSRLPNALLGGLTIIIFTALMWLWQSRRTAILASLLFATSAWVLHVSRLASYDVVYLCTLPTLLLINASLTRFKGPRVWYASLITLLLLLYVPGVIWLILPMLYLQRQAIAVNWRQLGSVWHRLVSGLIGVAGVSLLIIDLLRPGQLKEWLGLPAHFAGLSLTLKHFIAVPVHLLVRGPEYPALWLGRAPLLDIFTLAVTLIGIYFFATHLKAARSRLLAIFLIIGWLEIGLAGPVSLSLLVPWLYIMAGTGIAYLLHDWLKVFPHNPLVRSAGITLVSLVAILAMTYNLRAYFVAWPHNPVAQATFHYRR